jgi:regulator of sirC expression with transglutaminase-like and TPR domain
VPAGFIEEFARIVSASGESDLDLARAALVIARVDYPELDAGPYLRRLDEMADAVAERAPREGRSPVDVVRSLNRYLFVEQGYSGNAREYYDPRNSFLNQVIDRRLGIPVTLSLLYLEVGWRLGLPFEGVAFPGHFLVKLHVDEGDVVLDPYHRGTSLALEELAERARAALGGGEDLQAAVPRLLAAAGKRQILARMLGNLRAIYERHGDHLRLLHVLSLLLVLDPHDPEGLRRRAAVYQALGNAGAALADWRRYLGSIADGEEAERVRETILELEVQATPLH